MRSVKPDFPTPQVGRARRRDRHAAHRLQVLLLLVVLVTVACAPYAHAASSVYVVGSTTSNIWQFTILSDGALVSKSPAYLPTSTGPQFLAITPDARTVFVTDRDVDAVSPFDVGSGGALAPQNPATVGVVRFPSGIAISPDGQNAYIAGSFNNVVGQYSIGTGGTLTPKTPETVPAGTDPVAVAVSPDGQSVYVVNNVDSVSIGSVSQYTVGLDGRLTAKMPATVPARTGPMGIALTPDGKSAYVVNTDGTISQYDAGSGGLLSPKIPAELNIGAAGISHITVSPNGKSAYVPDPGADRVWQFDIGASGALSAKNPATVPTGDAPSMLAMTPDGKYAYVTNRGTNNTSEFTVNFDGALQTRTANAWTASGGTPIGIAVSPALGPTAAFTANGLPIGSPSAFDASSSSDDDGAVARYDWDWGDGSTWSDVMPLATHTYATPGSYTVTLTVTDNLGCSKKGVFTGQTAYCAGNPAASSSHTIVITSSTGEAPVSMSPPTISGTALEGRTLTEASGIWTQSPTSFNQRWSDCDTRGARCVAIAGATGRTLLLTGRDIGHTIRVSETATNRFGTRVSKVSTPTAVVLSATPKLTGLSLTPAKLDLPPRRPATGRLHFILSIPASVTVTVRRRLDGRLVAGRCVAPSRQNRRARHCTRYLTLRGTIRLAGRAGANHLQLTAKLGTRVLTAGSYQLRAVAVANGRRSAVRSFAFTIVR